MDPVISNKDARAIFLASHQLASAPTGAATGPALNDLINSIGFVQVDSINTVERAHHMILWARRKSYRPEGLKRLLERDRTLFEHWTHDASVLPVGLFPYWKHRFERDSDRLHQNWKRWFRDGYEAQFDTILNRIARDGPVSSADVGEGEARGKGGWWDWHPSKTALEWLWRTGKLSITRRDSFRKVYDLTERVIPQKLLSAEVDHEALVDWACSSALDRLGFADEAEIARYWNAIEKSHVQNWVKVQAKAGKLCRVAVEQADGSQRAAFMWAEKISAPISPVSSTMRILSPFDPALRDRARIERLFGFHYRIEVFVPEPKRIFGYYVFPVMEGDTLIGRLDAKAIRSDGRLHLRAFWPEPGVRMGRVRQDRLMAQTQSLAALACCDRVTTEKDWLRPYPLG